MKHLCIHKVVTRTERLKIFFLMTVSYLQSLSVSAGGATRSPTSAFVVPSSSSRISTKLKARRHQQEQQHLVLIGGGHSHVQVIKSLATRPEHLHVTLIDAQKSASYSGMVPGCIAGIYSPEETQLHLEPLAKWSDIEFIHDKVVDIDLERKLIFLQNTEQPVSYDAVSVDIGSTSRGYDECPGARTYAIPTRPIDKLIQRLDNVRIEALQDAQATTSQPKLVVVGGGAAGIELAMSITSRWNSDLPNSSQRVDCTLLDAGDRLLPDENDRARQALNCVLDSKGISVRHGCQVTEITEDAVHLASGDQIPYTICLWATGAGAHPLARQLQNVRGLDCSKHGWIQVQPTLQSTSHESVFAAGDCASITGLQQGSPPKAGVYAVRAGPVLIENLTNYLESIRDPANAVTRLKEYVPQDDFLKLLVCGDGKALGFRFGLALSGKWVFDLKDHIDRSFMKLFDVTGLPKPSRRDGKYDTSQYDKTDSDPPELLEADAAADLLQRTDDNVDFQQARMILRNMGNDPDYRKAVLQKIHEPEHTAILQTV